MDVKSHSRTSAYIYIAKESSTDKEKRFYAAEKVFRHDNGPTGTYFTLRWYRYGSRRTRLSPPSTFVIFSRKRIGGNYESKKTSIQGEKEEHAEKVFTETDDKQKEDYKKHHNRKRQAFAQATPPAQIIGRTTTARSLRTAIDRGRLEMTRWNSTKHKNGSHTISTAISHKCHQL